MSRVRRMLIVLLLAAATTGCSIRKMAINSMADSLSKSGDVFASDEDPDLVRAAVPFSLKTVESLLAEIPNHPGLLLTACSGFTQYAYAFIQADAEVLEPTDFPKSRELRDRALKMYLRARDYCLRNLALRHRDITTRLVAATDATLAEMRREEVPVLYWTGAAWGSAISAGLDRPALVADLSVVKSVMERALALDPTFQDGALHEVMIVLEGVPEAMGGSPTRARAHFDRAVAISQDRLASPYVTLATTISLPAQNRDEFTKLLEQALAVDPDKDKRNRLANLIAQKRAKFYLERLDELF